MSAASRRSGLVETGLGAATAMASQGTPPPLSSRMHEGPGVPGPSAVALSRSGPAGRSRGTFLAGPVILVRALGAVLAAVLARCGISPEHPLAVGRHDVEPVGDDH